MRAYTGGPGVARELSVARAFAVAALLLVLSACDAPARAQTLATAGGARAVLPAGACAEGHAISGGEMLRRSEFLDDLRGSQAMDATFRKENIVDVTASVVGIGRDRWTHIPEAEASLDTASRIMADHSFDVLLRAYRERCTACHLKHVELLEAAHILPDGHPLGTPIVANGLSLCKLHHAAFDRHILGVTPDYVIRIRSDILDEVDGPMLQHGLKEMEGRKLTVIPGSKELRPSREFLEERYSIFRRAG